MTSEAKALVKPTYSLTTELSNRATNTSLSTVTDSLPIPTVMIMLLRSPLGRRHRIPPSPTLKMMGEHVSIRLGIADSIGGVRTARKPRVRWCAEAVGALVTVMAL